VKRSGRDEPVWVAIHRYMEATLGISLYSYLYLKLSKTLCLSYYLLCFLFNKIGEQDVGTGSTWKGVNSSGVGGWRGVGEEMTQIMYTHVSKCKSDKIKNKILRKHLIIKCEYECEITPF
jgi:hypothetical protein